MDPAGLSFGVFQTFVTLTNIGVAVASAIRSAKNFGDDAVKLSARIANEVERTKQLQALLLEKGKIFQDATLFDQLPPETQENLVALLSLITGPLIGECGGIWSSYLVGAQTIAHYEGGGGTDDGKSEDFEKMVQTHKDNPQSLKYQENTRLGAKIRWALSDKKRAFDLVEQLSDTTRRIKDDIELFCFPLGILHSRAETLRADLDAQRLGWSADAALTQTIQEGSTSAGNLEIQISDLVEDGEHLFGSSCVRGYYRACPSIVQCKYYHPGEGGDADAEAIASIHALSALLKLASTSSASKFRLLPFSGFFQDMRRNLFGLVLQYPKSVDDEPPTTLLDILSPGAYNCPLEHRFKLAHTMATTLSELHRVKWIHKGLYSGNILFFRSVSSQESVGIRDARTKVLVNGPWVVGFDHARREDGKTSLATNMQFDRCVYRHPQRWADPFRAGRIHDIYSLGVILLEIGMWQPIIGCVPSDLRQAGSSMQRGVANIRLRNKILDSYRELCADVLPNTMGSRYSHIVSKCLTGDFDVQAPDKGDVELQKRFWIDVVDTLRRLAEVV